MGALHFGLDPRLLEALRRQLPLRTFVETGTHEARTTMTVAPLFDRVCTIELSPTLHERAKQKLAHFEHVEVVAGSSPHVLRARAPEFASSSVLYWLDAHWCGGLTAGAANECPLLAELAAIGELNDSSVVLIDDARYFLAPPPAPHSAAHWPRLLEVGAALLRTSRQHSLWIVNDVIVFAPKRIANDVIAYSRGCNVDLDDLVRTARKSADAGTAQAPAGTAAPVTDGRRGHGLETGFNKAFLGDTRPERIFAFHAERLGVTRVLDIGANSGQFAAKLRRLGFDGVIYSVEPQSAAHRELVKQAQPDVRWIPLPRQAAGRAHCRLDLNLSQNSWSSSILPVHENHLRAAPETRTVGQECVIVSKAADLLCEPLMRKIDALKIDVQGYELEVLEGLRSRMDGIRLVLLEMSLVECYVGAPDLFALDRFLVEELGFGRISLEPSYYDDGTGVAQQFDGLYARGLSRPAVERTENAHAFAAIVTSMHGAPSRKDTAGEEFGGEWRDLCIESWGELSGSVISVSETPPPDARLRWVKTDTRPSIAELFAAMPQDEGAHTILCNADILVGDDLRRLSPRLDPATVYLAHRVEVELNHANPQLLDTKAIHGWGFDLFLLPAEFARFVRDSRLLPAEFRIGEPWWDYLVPLIALAGGFPVKQLPQRAAVALHHHHPQQFGLATWLTLGDLFLTTAQSLSSRFAPRQCELLDDIASLTGPLETRLNALSLMMAKRLG